VPGASRGTSGVTENIEWFLSSLTGLVELSKERRSLSNHSRVTQSFHLSRVIHAVLQAVCTQHSPGISRSDIILQ